MDLTEKSYDLHMDLTKESSDLHTDMDLTKER